MGRIRYLLLAPFCLLLAISMMIPLSTDSSAIAASRLVPTVKSRFLKPVRIKIESIDLSARITSVGLDKQRVPIVPTHDIGWYNLSARPGEGENIVLWGHVLRFRSTPRTPAPFAHLKEASIGDKVLLYDAQGQEYQYTITQQIWANPDEVKYILPVGSERLTMVSCIGERVVSGNEVVDMSHRLITIAEPVTEN